MHSIPCLSPCVYCRVYVCITVFQVNRKRTRKYYAGSEISLPTVIKEEEPLWCAAVCTNMFQIKQTQIQLSEGVNGGNA